jgi:hypothetical protein
MWVLNATSDNSTLSPQSFFLDNAIVLNITAESRLASAMNDGASSVYSVWLESSPGYTASIAIRGSAYVDLSGNTGVRDKSIQASSLRRGHKYQQLNWPISSHAISRHDAGIVRHRIPVHTLPCQFEGFVFSMILAAVLC